MTQELIQKAKACKTLEELLALAQENKVEMTEDQAKDIFAKLNPGNGEIADEELTNVAGGCGSKENPYPHDPRFDGFITCSKCGGTQWGVGRYSIGGTLCLVCQSCGNWETTLIPSWF